MPYPSQVTYDELIDEARQQIETNGIESLSLSKLANAFGIKAPSLYKHVANKSALMQGVNLRTAEKLVAHIWQHVDDSELTIEKVVQIAVAYRAFVMDNPNTYSMAYSNNPEEERPSPEVLEQMAIPLQELLSEIVGEEKSLDALRGLWALIHGYSMLEVNQQFQRGGNLEQTFISVIKAYLKGWI